MRLVGWKWGWRWGALVQRVVKVVRNKTIKKKKVWSQFADSFYDCLGRQELSDSTTRRRIVAADGKWEPVSANRTE